MLAIAKKLMNRRFLLNIHATSAGLKILDLGESLYLAVLPLFESSDVYRENEVNKIIRQYKPFCNPESTLKAKSDYVIKTSKKIDDTNTDDTNTDDTNTDVTNTDDTNTDDTNTDDTNTDDTNTDDTNTDDTNTDDTNTDDTNTDDTNTDDTNTDDTNTKRSI